MQADVKTSQAAEEKTEKKKPPVRQLPAPWNKHDAVVNYDVLSTAGLKVRHWTQRGTLDIVFDNICGKL